MRVLVAWGSKRGGTEGIGRLIGDELRARGFEVVATAIDQVRQLHRFDAVIIGGALYANQWPIGVRQFVKRHLGRLRRVPVWLFSSGPLDASADAGDLPAALSRSIVTEWAVLARAVAAVWLVGVVESMLPFPTPRARVS
jgi:menaquinone-dependent protoporphyrinogen oxidase